MARTFGPIQGAGVQTTERDVEQPITAAALGWAAYAGLLERGPTDKLIFGLSKKNTLAQTGNLISESHLPDSVRDYFDLAGGAGGLLLVRVTSGTEALSSIPLYTRRQSRKALGRLDSKDGGRWGGFAQKATGEVATFATDITETTVDTGILTWNEDQWVGAKVTLLGVPNTEYEVVANDAAGVLTVSADATMLADLTALSSTDERWYVELEGRTDRGMTVEIDDGENDPDNEFSMSFILDGLEVLRYENLSVDTASPVYWVDIVNDDAANYYVTAVDTFVGARTPDVRPSNHYDKVSTGTPLAATVLTSELTEFVVASTAGTPTFGTVVADDSMPEQVITITMVDATTGNAVSDKFGALGLMTLDAPFVPDVKWSPGFTVTAGGTLAAAEVLTITYKPLGKTDSLVGGTLYPDVEDNGDKGYRIIANTFDTITVSVGSDMATDVSGGSDSFMVVAPQFFSGGRDGHADIVDNDYVQAYDIANSLFKQLVGNNLGLVKFACPGVTATAVQKAGAAFVSSKATGAHEWRYEVPSNVTTETALDTLVNKTLGKSPFGDYVVTAQSFVYVNDPEASGKLKLISATGMIHGREASITAEAGGFHKAEAGLAATLPRIVKLTTGETLLNEEFLNPRGINVIKKKGGQFVLWGDRTVTSNTGWKFKHIRETMSYYINVLNENFDFSVFEINDPAQFAVVNTALLSFFIPQYTIRALDNTLPLTSALVIKIDTENNTAATQADGDLHAEIILAIVGTVERLRFGIGRAGVLESQA